MVNYYIHMGLQRPHAYKTLLEFVFLDGRLIDVYGRSDVAEILRSRIDQCRAGADDSTLPQEEALPSLWWL